MDWTPDMLLENPAVDEEEGMLIDTASANLFRLVMECDRSLMFEVLPSPKCFEELRAVTVCVKRRPTLMGLPIYFRSDWE